MEETGHIKEEKDWGWSIVIAICLLMDQTLIHWLTDLQEKVLPFSFQSLPRIL
jgi:hypothetical protein